MSFLHILLLVVSLCKAALIPELLRPLPRSRTYEGILSAILEETERNGDTFLPPIFSPSSPELPHYVTSGGDDDDEIVLFCDNEDKENMSKKPRRSESPPLYDDDGEEFCTTPEFDPENYNEEDDDDYIIGIAPELLETRKIEEIYPAFLPPPFNPSMLKNRVRVSSNTSTFLSHSIKCDEESIDIIRNFTV